MARTRPKKRVLILGGGYVGLYVAWGLERHAELPMEVTLVEPRTYMTYQPLLPEVAGGHVEPRNVTVDLRQALTSTEVIRGSATGLDIDAHTATIETIDGETRTLQWDQVVLAMGAITRVFKTPGLAEEGIGFKTLDEAVYTRNKLLQNIAKAAATDDPAERQKYLTGVFIGGGYTGVEALAELSDLSKKAIKAYPQLAGEEPRWVVVEALDRIAPEVGPELSRWSLGEFEQRGVDIRLKTTMKSCENGDVVLSTGETIPAGLIVWTAGVKPNPVLDRMNVPRGPKGHVNANAKLQVIREDGTPVPGVWSAGDIAQVPDLTKEQPAFYPPNAQNAVRQATLLAESIAKAVRGRRPRNYVHYSLGTVASYGVLRGAANIKGVQLTEMWAWLAHRSYHLLAMPTFDRKWRILTNWAGDAVGRIDLTPTPSSQDSRDPQAEFAEAARTA